MNYLCYFDGACEPKNPGGNIGVGVHVIGSEPGNVFSTSYFIPEDPKNSNNVAEYLAFIKVLKLLKDKRNSTIEIRGDSKMVITQMKGERKISKGLYVEHAQEAQLLLETLKQHNNIILTWIPREENYIADELSKNHLLRKV